MTCDESLPAEDPCCATIDDIDRALHALASDADHLHPLITSVLALRDAQGRGS